MDNNACAMAGFGEPPHLVHGDAFLDARKYFLVAAFVAYQKEAQAGIFERFDGVVVEVGAAVATPGQTERGQLFSNFAGAREVGSEGIIVEEKLFHMREELLHVSHFVSDVLGGTNAIFVSANSLWPEA